MDIRILTIPRGMDFGNEEVKTRLPVLSGTSMRSDVITGGKISTVRSLFEFRLFAMGILSVVVAT